MDDAMERALAHALIFLDRSGFRWWLDGQTLARFVLGRDILQTGELCVGLEGADAHALLSRARQNAYAVEHKADTIHLQSSELRLELRLWSTTTHKASWRHHKLSRDAIIATGTDLRQHRGARVSCMSDHGLWRYKIDPVLPYSVSCPYGTGAYLDAIAPQWYLKPRPPRRVEEGVFFDAPRKVFGYRLLEAMYRLADAAGCGERMWLGFGGALGVLREGDFIAHDNDIDMCIDVEGDGAAEKRYVEMLSEPGSFEPDRDDPHHWRTMFEGRRKGPQLRRDNNVPLWLSLGPLKPESEHGVKACNWFCFRWNGYVWHSKGRGWVTPRKFDQAKIQFERSDEGIALGIPEQLIGGLQEIDFHGVRIRVPRNLGACCDYWYPGWIKPRQGGASAKHAVLVIGKWANKRTWRIV